MKWLVWLLVLATAGAVWLSLAVPDADVNLDTVEVNRIVKQIEADWPAAAAGRTPVSQIAYTFVPTGAPIATHVANQDTLVDVVVDGQLVGKVVIFNTSHQQLQASRLRLTGIFLALAVLLAIGFGAYSLHLNRTVLQPFHKLQTFATRVAHGDLNFPLPMDRQNQFGAFSESFDLMREQLAAAREDERQANISKKELVASLSHDVRTPVASIKVIAELYLAKHGPMAEMESILAKADQIDLLARNMFSATLEELQQLTVKPTVVSSLELADQIRIADYLHRIQPFVLPECLVTVDRLRFRQVIDNLIDNSYKYAATEIDVSGKFEEDYLLLSFRDYGPGVRPEEVSLLCQKFHRASNAEGKDGSGLGLYICRYLIVEMGGSLEIESGQNNQGFCVQVRLKI